MADPASSPTGPVRRQPPDDDRARRADPDVPPPPPGDWPLGPAAGPLPGLHPGGWAGPDGAPAVGLGLALAAIGAYLAGQLGLQLVLGLVLVATGIIETSALAGDGTGTPLLALLVASQVAGLAAVLLLLRRRGVALGPLVGPLRPLGRDLRVGVMLGLLAIVGSTIVVSVLVALSGSDATPEQVLTRDVVETPAQLALAIVAAVVLAPLAEELVFRGLLHRAHRARLAAVTATLGSSLLFAVVHVDVLMSQPIALIGLTLVGAVLAVAYERTGRLVVPVVIHAVHNATTLLAVVIAARFEGAAADGSTWSTLLAGALGMPA